MSNPPSLTIAIWLPRHFYAAVAATLAEMFELVNQLRGETIFLVEFIGEGDHAVSSTGISFPTLHVPTKQPDVLIVLAVPGMEKDSLIADLEREFVLVSPILKVARDCGALIAAHCSASYFLAMAGLLHRKAATVSWWLKEEVMREFPVVRWDPSRLLVRDGNIYTCGGGFSGLELGKALLKDLGFANEERLVRKYLVLPPSRSSQTPYEIPLESISPPTSLREKLDSISVDDLTRANVGWLGNKLGISKRTLARRFADEIGLSPGQWLMDRRLSVAKRLLETSNHSIALICQTVGYEDMPSFNRLFSRMTGMTPGAYRRQSK